MILSIFHSIYLYLSPFPVTIKLPNRAKNFSGALGQDEQGGDRMEDAKAAERRRLETLVQVAPVAKQETTSVSSAGAGKGSSTGGNRSESSSLLGAKDAKPKTPLEWFVANWILVLVSLLVCIPLVFASIGLTIALMADPSKDFSVVNGDCRIGEVIGPERHERTYEETGTYCQDDYTYSYCLPENGDFKTYPAGRSPIELCSACVDTGKTPSSTHAAVACVEGDATYASCIAALPCMQSAKWNQHKQLSVNASHFDCEVAIHGISTESGVNPTDSTAMPEKPKHRRLAGSDCFGSTKEVRTVQEVDRQEGFTHDRDPDLCDGSNCAACEGFKTTPHLAEGDEVTCWAPAPGQTPGFPVYTCLNPGCYKMIK